LVERSGESAQILGISESKPTTAQELMAMVHPGDRERVTAAIAELGPVKDSGVGLTLEKAIKGPGSASLACRNEASRRAAFH
jgi:hypothetical protein